MAIVSFKRILSGIKYGIIAEGLFLILQIFMILFVFDTDFGFTSFEYSFFIFGGIYLTISGCIGPGGYKKEYKILLFWIVFSNLLKHDKTNVFRNLQTNIFLLNLTN